MPFDFGTVEQIWGRVRDRRSDRCPGYGVLQTTNGLTYTKLFELAITVAWRYICTGWYDTTDGYDNTYQDEPLCYRHNAPCLIIRHKLGGGASVSGAEGGGSSKRREEERQPFPAL